MWMDTPGSAATGGGLSSLGFAGGADGTGRGTSATGLVPGTPGTISATAAVDPGLAPEAVPVSVRPPGSAASPTLDISGAAFVPGASAASNAVPPGEFRPANSFDLLAVVFAVRGGAPTSEGGFSPSSPVRPSHGSPVPPPPRPSSRSPLRFSAVRVASPPVPRPVCVLGLCAPYSPAALPIRSVEVLATPSLTPPAFVSSSVFATCPRVVSASSAANDSATDPRCASSAIVGGLTDATPISSRFTSLGGRSSLGENAEPVAAPESGAIDATCGIPCAGADSVTGRSTAGITAVASAWMRGALGGVGRVASTARSGGGTLSGTGGDCMGTRGRLISDSGRGAPGGMTGTGCGAVTHSSSLALPPRVCAGSAVCALAGLLISSRALPLCFASSPLDLRSCAASASCTSVVLPVCASTGCMPGLGGSLLAAAAGFSVTPDGESTTGPGGPDGGREVSTGLAYSSISSGGGVGCVHAV